MVAQFKVQESGQFRFRLKHRWFRDPFIILQKELVEYKNTRLTFEQWREVSRVWRDVKLEDLTTMGLKTLISQRDPDSLPICFKPVKRLFGWSLVLMVCEGSWADGYWRPARLQDLMIKDGKIQGGLGLVRR